MAKITDEKIENQKYTIYSPAENYCGVGAGGIQFAYGKAQLCDGWLLEWYKEKGYKVEVAE